MHFSRFIFVIFIVSLLGTVLMPVRTAEAGMESKTSNSFLTAGVQTDADLARETLRLLRQKDTLEEQKDELERAIEVWKKFITAIKKAAASINSQLSRVESIDATTFQTDVEFIEERLRSFLQQPEASLKKRANDLERELEDKASPLFLLFDFRSFMSFYSDPFPERTSSDGDGSSSIRRQSLRDRLNNLPRLNATDQSILKDILIKGSDSLSTARAGLPSSHRKCSGALDDLSYVDLSLSDRRNEVLLGLNSCVQTSSVLGRVPTLYASYAGLINKVETTSSGVLAGLTSASVKNRAELDDTKSRLVDIDKAIEKSSLIEKNLVIHESAQKVIFYTLGAWVIIITLFAVAIILLNHYQVRRLVLMKGKPDPRGEFSYILFLEMMTVFLLTGSILVLGIAGKIDKQGLTALIGGISGYVLGRMSGGSHRAG